MYNHKIMKKIKGEIRMKKNPAKKSFLRRECCECFVGRFWYRFRIESRPDPPCVYGIRKYRVQSVSCCSFCFAFFFLSQWASRNPDLDGYWPGKWWELPLDWNTFPRSVAWRITLWEFWAAILDRWRCRYSALFLHLIDWLIDLSPSCWTILPLNCPIDWLINLIACFVWSSF